VQVKIGERRKPMELSERASVYYRPKEKDTICTDCVYLEDYLKFTREIEADDKLSGSQKNVLTALATRFIIFRYEKIADYYAQTNDHMKEWLEKLRCVIVDKDKAIQNGYIKYMEDYEKILGEIVDEK